MLHDNNYNGVKRLPAATKPCILATIVKIIGNAIHIGKAMKLIIESSKQHYIKN